MKLVIDKNNVIADIGNDIIYARPGAEDGGLMQCTEDEATHIWNKEKNVAYMAHQDYEIVEVEIVPENVEPTLYKYVDGKFTINVEQKRRYILDELNELDVVINRATEDLYIATKTTPYTNVQEVINRKNELRTELATLN